MPTWKCFSLVLLMSSPSCLAAPFEVAASNPRSAGAPSLRTPPRLPPFSMPPQCFTAGARAERAEGSWSSLYRFSFTSPFRQVRTGTPLPLTTVLGVRIRSGCRDIQPEGTRFGFFFNLLNSLFFPLRIHLTLSLFPRLGVRPGHDFQAFRSGLYCDVVADILLPYEGVPPLQHSSPPPSPYRKLL